MDQSNSDTGKGDLILALGALSDRSQLQRPETNSPIHARPARGSTGDLSPRKQKPCTQADCLSCLFATFSDTQGIMLIQEASQPWRELLALTNESAPKSSQLACQRKVRDGRWGPTVYGLKGEGQTSSGMHVESFRRRRGVAQITRRRCIIRAIRGYCARGSTYVSICLALAAVITIATQSYRV